MNFEIILGLIVAVLAGIGGAFGLGHSKGISKAQAAADKQRTEENAAAVEAVSNRRVEATKGASDVQQSVNHMSDDNVDHELREKFRRPSSG